MSCGSSDLHSGLQLGNQCLKAWERCISQLLLCCSQRPRQLPVQFCQDAQPAYSRGATLACAMLCYDEPLQYARCCKVGVQSGDLESRVLSMLSLHFCNSRS